MKLNPRRAALVLLFLGSSVFSQWAVGNNKDKHNSGAAGMEDRKRAVHALNRLTFGPGPGDPERVMALGVDRWIQQQLHPEKIDDTALETRLAAYLSLRMNTRELVENFPPEPLIKAIAEGKQSLPSDRVRRAIYEAQLERYEEKLERKQEAQANDRDFKTDSGGMNKAESKQDRMIADEKLQPLLTMSPDRRFQAVLAMPPDEQRDVARQVKPEADELLAGMTPRQRETLQALRNPQQVVADELLEAKLLRAVYSERQLQEVMTDFWFNHFNVFIGKGADHYFLTSYERDVIRPHAFGKFEDLLVATAQSPAMLFYLDNWLSVGPNSDFANGIYTRRKFRQTNRPPRQAGAKRGGLNENYGRELMELHTLGVNGGYGQKDVTEVARVFTGWTLKEPRQGGGFIFDERKHDPGDKTVLGHRIKPGGEREGWQVLHILAHQPATAKFICTKLAVRFVSDDPPPDLVNRMATTFLRKDGDIREVLKTMLDSPEFWADEEYRAKVKTPLEFVASSLRATGADVNDPMPIVRRLQDMGMPLYGAQPPTGYSMKSDAWVNSSALLARMNFALTLAAGKLKGTLVDRGRLFGPEIPPDPEQALAVLEKSLLAQDVSKQTHDVIAARLQDPDISQRKYDDPARPPNVGVIEGLLLGSPEFQRR
ncbi:MAG TPA: DUF1800 domain-containing protein [Terriglobales bacterium]|nr:DUF1800 domain-containing protein [Terriglobales bacterium]